MVVQSPFLATVYGKLFRPYCRFFVKGCVGLREYQTVYIVGLLTPESAHLCKELVVPVLRVPVIKSALLVCLFNIVPFIINS